MSENNDVCNVAPTALGHLIGQTAVVEQVRVALDAAHQDGRKFDHSLLVGPPGCGKTQTSKVIAAEMAGEYVEVLGQAVQAPADFNALLLGLKDRDVLLVDEAHELDREFQTALYLALDQRKVLLSGRSGRTIQSVPLADFTLLLATTDEFKLLAPLRDRMRLVLRFTFYSADELAELVRQRCHALRWSVEDSVVRDIAVRSRGTPRLALRLLQSCHRVCRSVGADAIMSAHLSRACTLEGIDSLGLGPTEQQYLRAVAEGASRLNVIASRMGLPARTVADVCEPVLIRFGLLTKDEQGRRQLTAEGRNHLSQSREHCGSFGGNS
jgi:Holliday junction DNA helicase RuvB